MAKRVSLSGALSRGLATITKSNDLNLVTDFRGIIGPIRESFAGAWQRNITVEPAANLPTYAPIYSCLTRISGDIAKLALKLRVYDDSNVSVPAPKTSPFWNVLRRPNSFQNTVQFVRYWLLCKLIHGNAYAIKQRDARGIVTALYLLDPRRVSPLVTPDGSVYYGIASDYLSQVPYGMGACRADDIIHDRGPTLWHPLVGVAPLYAAALSGTLGLRIQQNSSAFFTNQSKPGGILTAPGAISDETALRLRTEFEQNFTGSKAGGIAVLGDGLAFNAMAVVAEQSQTAEQLGMSAVDCATAFNMPAYKINQGAMPASTNISALNQQYYSDCLQIYIEEFESCMNDGLSVPDGYSVEFDLDGLLRMDAATQMTTLAAGVGGAILKPNEARQRLNIAPAAGGDQVFLQQQNYSLEALGKRDAKEDPFASAKSGTDTTPAPVAAPAPATSADTQGKFMESMQALVAVQVKAMEAMVLMQRGEPAPIQLGAEDDLVEKDFALLADLVTTAFDEIEA